MNQAGHEDTQPHTPRVVKETGPWPFITRKVFELSNQSRSIWTAREHRKGLSSRTADNATPTAARWHCLWMPRELNWWIGTVFAVGSLLFVVGSAVSLVPAAASDLDVTAQQINAIFFAGSIPFTVAAYLQLFQAANAGTFRPDGVADSGNWILLGWRPKEAGWLSCALQFAGTLLFNVNTYDAMHPAPDWLRQDLAIWVPDFVGSILFLASGYLAFIEAGHTHWSWQPANLAWWVTFVNLLGCVGFMVSALFAVALPGPPDVTATTIATAFTLQGAVCFLIGACLLLPEASGAGST
ncbi:hypothetical protein Mal4_54900 [Maioricimonas rarisocia]|uniref:YrhK domain-containing protein n=1 Tax=Maioricimonas rarisocia TaxID=2528026 RepID=A0A517ZF58_9PLAN|nr:hypothetical protein [Maioricimonas rarisocia]QDU41125.1 hypothetical protein Mal4_54900 [Maioricimonas rarisocia]